MRLFDRHVIVRNGWHLAQLRTTGPDARPWRVTVFRLEAGGYLARAIRDYGDGSGRFRSRAMETWWGYDAARTPREAVQLLRAVVRRSFRQSRARAHR